MFAEVHIILTTNDGFTIKEVLGKNDMHSVQIVSVEEPLNLTLCYGFNPTRGHGGLEPIPADAGCILGVYTNNIIFAP